MSDSTQQDQAQVNMNEGVGTSTANSNGTNIQTSNASGVTQDSKNMALINWLGCLFFSFIPPLILLLIKKDDAYVQSQAKEALNWVITFFVTYFVLWIIAMVIGFVLAFVWGPLAMIPMFFLMLFGFSHLIFCVMGAIKCSSGQNFKVPFNFRLIK
ncbi:DUF4870 domain-containing protein [Psychrobacter sp. 72-O-c]|uniref:DUF4870 domain-containing protein n=1 Tax=Psychrobacter sp. 72-O-c TaxID=2774125 RepID=UPI00191A316E|nr:DUF4870 domain-containing protein [Psychrobacter sp. 72-O-c]